jgi:hypothetical protein
MSTDEQDAALGRAVREQSDLARQSALIDIELRRFSEGLHHLALIVDRRIPGLAAPYEEMAAFPDSVVKYADLAKLSGLMEEQERIRKKWNELGGVVARFRT